MFFGNALIPLLAAAGLTASGCAYKPITQPSSPVPATARTLSAADVPADLSLALHARFLQFGSPLGPSLEKWWAKQQTHLRARAEAICKDTPWLSAARWDAPDAPYRIVLEVTFDSRGKKFLYTLTDMTNYLFPSSDEGVVWAQARVYRKGDLIKEYETEGTYRTRRHLIFLLLPMLWHSKVPAQMAEAAIQNVLRQVEQDAPTLFIR